MHRRTPFLALSFDFFLNYSVDNEVYRHIVTSRMHTYLRRTVASWSVPDRRHLLLRTYVLLTRISDGKFSRWLTWWRTAHEVIPMGTVRINSLRARLILERSSHYIVPHESVSVFYAQNVENIYIRSHISPECTLAASTGSAGSSQTHELMCSAVQESRYVYHHTIIDDDI